MIENALPQSLVDNPRLDQWIEFAPPGFLVLKTGKVELGQGVLTALAQIAADELDIGMMRIRIVSGNTARTPDEGFTAGSRSIEHAGGALRLVCAEARGLFLQAAALHLGCAPSDLEIDDGRFRLAGAAVDLDYWRLADRVDLARSARGTVPVKRPPAYRLVGSDIPRIDLPDKLGGAPFIHDIFVDGMLHARVLHRPRLGARLVAWDEQRAFRAGRRAVAFLRRGDVVAVFGEDETDVAAAFESVGNSSKWSGGVAYVPQDEEALSLLDLPQNPARVIECGHPVAAPPARHVEATYSRPYLAHGSIAPSCGLAYFENGSLTVWSHSQGVFFLKGAIARALALDPARVTVIHHQGAGCYGHNGADDAAFDAALVAVACPGRHVRVMWTREDELCVAPFGAAMVVRIKAGLDAEFRPAQWQLEIWSPTHSGRPGMNGAVNLLTADALETPPVEPPPSDLPDTAGGGAVRNAIALYDFPHQTIVHHFVPNPPLRTSSMRGLGAFINVFAIESFVDELASQAGTDPVTYRLSLMSDSRARRVIEAAASMAEWWRPEPPPANTARGFAFSRYKNVAAYLALVVEVSVDEEVRLNKVWCAVDAGLVINPDGARNQIEGGILQAASWTLKEQVRLNDGYVASDRWERYPILRFSEVPTIETTFVGAPNDPTLGVGEASQGPTAAAIGNAMASALGTRLFHLPFTRERIVASLLQNGT